MNFEEFWKDNAYFHGSTDKEYRDRMKRMFKQTWEAGQEAMRKRCEKLAENVFTCTCDRESYLESNASKIIAEVIRNLEVGE